MGPTSCRLRPPRSRPARRVAGLLLTASIAVAVAACGGESATVLTGDAARGQKVAKDKGCTSCHTPDGRRSEGPTWKGLAGSTVTLSDGTTVVADDAYLARSITDPRSQVKQGFRTPMPVQSNISADDIAALTAYIKALR